MALGDSYQTNPYANSNSNTMFGMGRGVRQDEFTNAGLDEQALADQAAADLAKQQLNENYDNSWQDMRGNLGGRQISQSGVALQNQGRLERQRQYGLGDIAARLGQQLAGIGTQRVTSGIGLEDLLGDLLRGQAIGDVQNRINQIGGF